MAGTTQMYKVHCHYENAGKKIGPDYFHYINAATGDYNTLAAVIAANGLVHGSGTLVIEAVQNVGPGVNPTGATSNVWQ